MWFSLSLYRITTGSKPLIVGAVSVISANGDVFSSMEEIDAAISKLEQAKGSKHSGVAALQSMRREFSPGEFELPRTPKQLDVSRIQRIMMRDEGTKRELNRPDVNMTIWTGSVTSYKNA